MKLNTKLYIKFAIPSGVLIGVSILLLLFSTFLLFSRTQKVSYNSKSFISDTWTVAGVNSGGQFCDGTTISNNSLTQFQNSGDIIAISGGADHVLALKNDNTIKACGSNSKGQLGDGTTINKTNFVNISSLTGIVQVAAGDKISYALNGLGQVYKWGGVVTGNSSTPTIITGLGNIVSITTSENTLLAIDSNSNLYVYGLNANGESGNGNSLAIITPAIVESGVSSARCSKEACAIVKSGSVFAAGNNSKKELADDMVTSRNTFGLINTQRSPAVPLANITSIASGPSSYNFYALDSGGKVWSWGNSSYLGYSLPGNVDGDLARNITSLTSITQISGAYPLALRAGGTLFTWTNSAPTLINGIQNVTKINQGGGQTMYVRGDLYNPINTAEISSLNPTCVSAEVNSTTTCSFVLPGSKDLPSALYIGIGDAVPTGICSGVSTIICVNIPTGSIDGESTIYIKIGNGSSIASLGTALVKKSVISNANIASQSGTCTPGTVSQGALSDCTFPLVGSSSFNLPTNGLRAAITNISGVSNSIIGPSNPCTVSANTLTCTGIPSFLGNSIATLGTHEVIVYESGSNNYFLNKASITVNSLIISDTNILTSTECVDTNFVQLGNTYNCTFNLTGSISNFYSMPVDGVVVKTGAGATNSPLCVILDNGLSSVKLSCNNIPTVGVSRGVQDVFVKSGSGLFKNKGGVTVQDTIIGSDLGNLNITCNKARTDSTTTCFFDIPLYTANSQISIGIGDSSPGGNCSFSGSTATCVNVPTGPSKGNQVIYAQLPSGSKVNTGKTVELNKVFQDSSIAGTIFSCANASINSTTTCTFNFPQFEVLDSGFGMRIGNAASVNSCTLNALIVTCTGVNTGATSGDQIIFAGTSSQIDTGETAFLTRSLTQADLSSFAQLVSLTCLPNPIAVFSDTTCAGTLPNYTTTTNSNFKLRINGENEASCAITGKAFRCANLPTGAGAGEKSIQVSLDGGGFKDTGLFVTISNKIIGDAEFAIIGDPSKTQVLSQFKCGINGVVYAGKTTTCTIEVAQGWVIFPGLKMSVEIDPPLGKCSQNGTTITCIGVPVTEDTSDPGVLFLVNKSGQTIFVGVTYSVQPAPKDFVYVPPTNPTTTPAAGPVSGTPTATDKTTQPSATNVKETTRSGGFSIVLVVTLFLSWSILFYIIFIKRKNINK
jgi:alpha-tubulin suppressor-like RCC1 family protein